MIRKVRSKVASSLSKITEAEDFNFSNWLKKPGIHQHSVGSLESRLHVINDLVLDFSLPENAKLKFNLENPVVTDELKNCEFQKVRSNAIFFTIPYPSYDGTLSYDVVLKHLSYSARDVEFLIKIPILKKIKVKFDYLTPLKIDCTLEVPAIFNYLSEMVPEIQNIELLDFEDLINTSKKIEVKNFKFDSFSKTKVGKQALPELNKLKKIYKIKVPSVAKFTSSQQDISIPAFSQLQISNSYPFILSKVKNWYAKFQLPKLDSFLFYRVTDDNLPLANTEKVEGQKGYSNLREQLKFILGNVKKFDWEKDNYFKIKLKSFEEAAAKFLVENEYALLQDEFGIDIETEVIGALKVLFGNKVIKSALVITSQSKIGNPAYAKHLSTEIGWSDKIYKYCSELSVNVIDGNNDERADLWKKSKSISLVDIDKVISDYHLKILEENTLNKYDCIILDDVHSIFTKQEKGKDFLSVLKPQIFWATSCHVNKNLQKEINNWLNPAIKIEKVQLRTKESLEENESKFMLKEVWIEADEEQVEEFKVSMVDCKKDLRRVLESGNPLRFVANIFTLFHRLNQIGNFAPGKTQSPKTEVLLEHIKNIKQNGKKAIILSQYDRVGTKKIGDLLTKNGIKNLIAPGSYSVEEMKNAISTFKSKSDTVAFISDAKSAKIKLSDIDVSYVIRFDQWWNPISNWELEDMYINRGEDSVNKESVNIYNYYSLGTIDHKLRELLLQNDLLNKNVFELMQPKLYEELISMDEWLKIFNMPGKNESKAEQSIETVLQQIKNLSFDSFRTVLLKFFTMLGYANLDIIELPNSNSFNIVGKAQRNNRIFCLVARVFTEQEVNDKTLENILSETSKSINDKIFLITRDKFPALNDDVLRENVTLLDGTTLSKFFIRLGINPSNK